MQTPAAGTVDLREALDRWLERTPIVTRALSVMTIACFFLGIAVGNQAIATVPLFVLENFEFYRLIISPLFESHLFALLMVLIWLNRVGIKLEQDLGSRKTLTVFAQVSVSINLVFCAIVLTLSQLVGAGYMMLLGCQGFFPTIVSLLVILPPQGPVSLALIPGRIPPAFAPYALIALSTLISGSLPLDLLCALVVGVFFKRVLARLMGIGEAGAENASGTLPFFTSAPNRAAVGDAAAGPMGWPLSPTSRASGPSPPRPSRDLLREAAQARMGGAPSSSKTPSAESSAPGASGGQPAAATPAPSLARVTLAGARAHRTASSPARPFSFVPPPDNDAMGASDIPSVHLANNNKE